MSATQKQFFEKQKFQKKFIILFALTFYSLSILPNFS